MALHNPIIPPSEPERLVRVASWFRNESVALNVEFRRLLPEPHRSRISSRLMAASWRMQRYLSESEAGTLLGAEALCQARMLRMTLDSAAWICQEALNWLEANQPPVSDQAVAATQRLLCLASAAIPTFPPSLNQTRYRMETIPAG